MNIITKFLKSTKKYIDDLIRLEQTPHNIALGFSIGTFISNMPTPGLNILFGILIAYLFKKVNKLSLFIGILIWNPILVPLLYSAGFKLGQFILNQPTIIEPTIYELFFHYFKPFLLGMTILALFFSLVSYILVYLGTYFYQRKIKK
ncbi:MAG: DUF2062 domain-containing protein [Candidatus Woesearchaeota archaeon]